MSKNPNGQKKHRFSRFLLTLVIILFAAVNIWTFIDIYQFSLLVVSVDAEADELNLFETETQELAVNVRSFGLSETLGLSEPVLMWSSDNEAVAKIDENGSISAVAPGSATITVTESRSGLADTCAVRVYSLTDIVLNHSDYKLGAGEKLTLAAAVSSNEYADPFEYTSSDESVAVIDADGVVTAVSSGEAVITVNARGYTGAECALTVRSAPSKLVVSDSDGICLNETRELSFVLGKGEYCSEFVCSSSDTSVIKVEGEKIKAVGTGTAKITAKTYNGLSCEHIYNVKPQPDYVKLGRSKMTVYSEMGEKLIPTDSTGFCEEYYYSTSDPNIVTVEPDGTLIGHNRGTATVTCSTFNGKTNNVTVNVKIVNYRVPYTYERVEQNIAALQKTFPELIRTEVIGSSVCGRNITLVKLGNGERKVLVAAGIHSRENISVSFTMRCIEEYASAYYTRRGYYDSYNLHDLLSRYTIYLVPLVNPDGLNIVTAGEKPLYTSEPLENPAKFKNNANGVNLNRNYPFMWGYSGEDGTVNVTEPDTDSYAGASEASEPETQAIVKLCRANSFEWLLDMHCRGNLIYYQDKFSPVQAADNHLASLLDRRCGYTLTDKSTGYEVSGGMENWFRSEFGKPAICVELVLNNYAYVVNEKFDAKLNWEKTRNTFLVGLD